MYIENRTHYLILDWIDDIKKGVLPEEANHLSLTVLKMPDGSAHTVIDYK